MSESNPTAKPTGRQPDAGPFAIRVWKFDHWVYVGRVYADKAVAASWVSFVRSAWHGMRTVVVSKQQVEREKKRAARAEDLSHV